MSLQNLTPEGWQTSWELVTWAAASLNIMTPSEHLSEPEIRRIMRWIGWCSVDTIYIDGEVARLGRIGISNMLFVTLMEFPAYYMKYELAQFN